MHEITKLPNGLTVLTQTLPGIESATVLVLVGAGSRYEIKPEAGIAHFLEHIFFKGGKIYKSSEEVARAIDEVGGDFNAFTGKEYAGYYVKVDARHLDRAYDVLSDMLLQPTFSEEDLERERGVIRQEYEMYQDTPMYQIGWNFEHLLFGDQPLGWDQIGTPEFISAVSSTQIHSFRNKLYTPENCVIAVAGAVNHADVVAAVQKYFPFPTSASAPSFLPFDTSAQSSRIQITTKKTEQAHLILGVKGYASQHPDRYAQSVLATLLGGGMSSRMFLEVREKLSLCYAIRTTAETFVDVGVVSTYAGVQPSRLSEAITAILAEYRKVMQELPSLEEVNKNKELIKGKLTLSLEDSEEVAHSLARQQLLRKEILTPTEIKAKIDAVTPEDVQRVANDLLKPENLTLSLIGPFENNTAEFEKLLKY